MKRAVAGQARAVVRQQEQCKLDATRDDGDDGRDPQYGLQPLGAMHGDPGKGEKQAQDVNGPFQQRQRAFVRS
ncbi:MAG: hypothetical protein CVU19_06685 [Betaproteobacteria bacterium HGW-Betaproteobacteria-13]|nr:MAG: hypothetical protein CVU19_06685 [Betaproteobacteria bacterium HGW-Betaproteobacteria-13]